MHSWHLDIRFLRSRSCSKGPINKALGVALVLMIITVSFAMAAQTPSVDPAQAAAAAPAGGWLGPDGDALPFATHGEVLEFLAHAEIVDRKVIEGSANRPLRLTLERDGVRARAIFRTVRTRGFSVNGKVSQRMLLRDDYLFEVAAYTLSYLLGLDHVPPATLREVDGKEGSIQLWVEKARTETARIEKDGAQEMPNLFNLQMHRLLVFDALILNYDRNAGNILVDERGKVWFVDHTRSFMRVPSLAAAEKLSHCDHHLWREIQELDPKRVKASLAPYLSKGQIQALLTRHRHLIRRIEVLIAEAGEEQVLFELDRHLPS